VSELGGVAVGKAATAADAALLAERHKPDLVLMDVKLRGRHDGVTAAHEIDARSRTSIAFVTAYDDEDIRRRIRDFNGSLPIAKPLALQDLAALMYASATSARGAGRARQ
jgi:DNA-binding response OmpR family regulator